MPQALIGLAVIIALSSVLFYSAECLAAPSPSQVVGYVINSLSGVGISASAIINRINYIISILENLPLPSATKTYLRNYLRGLSSYLTPLARQRAVLTIKGWRQRNGLKFSGTSLFLIIPRQSIR